jgi:acetyl-CoA carboxylase biotin carboxyl carrier protein
MIDITKVKELVALMKDNDLTEVSLSDEKESIALKRGQLSTVVNHQPVIYNGGGPSIGAPAAYAPTPAPAPAQTFAPAAPVTTPAPAPAADDSSFKSIDSPMVGTFYAAPNPEAPTFVKVGQNISAGTVVCLIEAMKVFNEIKSDVSGTIERLLVKSGDPVEFGQKLFLVKPS